MRHIEFYDKNRNYIFNNKLLGTYGFDSLVDKIMADALINLTDIYLEGFVDFNIYNKGNKIIIELGIEPEYNGDKYIMYHLEKDTSRCYVEKGTGVSINGYQVSVDERHFLLDESCSNEDYTFMYRWSQKICDTMDLEKDDLCDNSTKILYNG